MNKENSIILLRTSTKKQNPKLELEDCQTFNDQHNWTLAHEPFEKQESAYKTPDIWKEELQWAITHNVQHVIVWNMDRFSRRPEDEVLKQVKLLSLLHGIKLHAAHGDQWSELVESIGKLKEMGFIGEAISEFMEKVLSGMEFRRAHRESQVKSERVQSAVRIKEGVTVSHKGNKWGRKAILKTLTPKILELRHLSIRQIIKQDTVFYYDKNNNAKKPSIGTVQKILAENPITKS